MTPTLKTLLTLICLIFLLLDVGFSQSIVFRNDIFDTALQQAERENKLVFIDTWAEWCGPCKIMEPIFRDPELATYMNNHFINVRIDMGTESEVKKQVSQKYDIFFLPTLLILDQNGQLMFRSDNKLLTAQELVNIARAMNTPKDYILAQSKPQASSDSRLLDDEATTVDKIKITDDMMLAKDEGSGANVLVPTPAINDPYYSEDPNEKILYTLGEGDELPPEILYEEAYFRLTQLSDGSHKETVEQYLDTQQDWSTKKNIMFVFDFLDNTTSKQFQYMIENRSLFESMLGKEKVSESIGILVFQKLYQAIQRPDIEEAETLFSYVDKSTSKKKAKEYIRERQNN